MEKYTYNDEGFYPFLTTDTFKVAYLRYNERFSRLTGFERHMKTDEVFLLLEGRATLYIKTEQGTAETEMEKGIAYNIPKGEWHHIAVSEDATVLVVENSDTSIENTEKAMIDK